MDLEQKLTELDKKLSKILNLNTKIAKALHLIPVTPKEEKAMQLLQRKNASLAQQVFDELEHMENPDPKDKDDDSFNLFDTYEQGDIYNDVLGSDFLDDFRKGGE
jgi:hypothetical protein